MPLISLNLCKPIKGFIFSTKYPSVLVSLTITECENEKILNIANQLSEELGLHNLLSEKKYNTHTTYNIFSQFIEEIISLSGWPIFQKNVLISFNQAGNYLFLIPSIKNGFPLLIKTIETLTDLFNIAANRKTTKEDYEAILNIIKKLKSFAPKDTNTKNFIKAALNLKIPFNEIVNGLYQFGYSKNSRWLQSTFTDQTSQISAALARNKSLSNQLLNECGLPVPKNVHVNDLQSAINAAKILTYPVVVKPMDLDGGAGVFANIKNEENLVSCYKKTIKFSKNVLIEKHCAGKDYRLVVHDNQVIFAIERVPASITGDGVSTITQLINLSNKYRESKPSLTKLTINEEAKALLKENNYSENSIPNKGETVYLRSIANIGAGGIPKPVLDKVHPDNMELVIQATKSIGLDIAGIDLLIPDISKSWKEKGNSGFICEVNSQPTLGSLTSSHLYGYLLEKLLPHKGRIPITLVLADSSKVNIAETIDKKISLANIKTGFISDKANDNLLNKSSESKNTSFYENGLIFSKDKNIQTVIIDINKDNAISNGLAFSYIDTLLIAGTEFSCESTNNEQSINKILNAILPMVDSKIIYTCTSLNQTQIENINRYTKLKKIEFKKLSINNAINEVVSSITTSLATV